MPPLLLLLLLSQLLLPTAASPPCRAPTSEARAVVAVSSLAAKVASFAL